MECCISPDQHGLGLYNCHWRKYTSDIIDNVTIIYRTDRNDQNQSRKEIHLRRLPFFGQDIQSKAEYMSSRI